MAFLHAPDPGPTPASHPIAVLVVDDQPAVREGLARLLACATPVWRAIETASQGHEALRRAAALHPEVVILDADLGGEDGLALIPHFAPAAVLVLTCHGDPATRQRASLLGAAAFLEKHRPAHELLDAVHRLATLQMRGEMSPAAARTSSRVQGWTSSDAALPGGF